eukprot:gene3683-4200_t
MVDNVAISASILAMLSLVSITLGVCMFLVFWKYHANQKKKTAWKTTPSELRTGWLKCERKPLDEVKKEHFEQKEDDVDLKEDEHSCGEIVFILRYLVDKQAMLKTISICCTFLKLPFTGLLPERASIYLSTVQVAKDPNDLRQELMVRLVQMEGFPVSSEDIYNADSAYVDVQLKHIGGADDKMLDNPPKLDIALQQVYFFLMSQDQLFSYKLVFKVNTFDESFRRSVSGQVEVNLFEELGKHIFTGDLVILSKKILPVSSQTSNAASEHEEEESKKEEAMRRGGVTSPAASPLSWDSECDKASSRSSELVAYEQYSEGVQWHRLSGDSWDENVSFQWPNLSESVVSVPSSFQFSANNVTERSVSKKTAVDHLRIEEPKDSPLLRRSLSESYVPHYGRLSPPPKNFYHIVPIPLSTKIHKTGLFSRKQRHTAGNRVGREKEQVFTFEHEPLRRRRSLSVPSQLSN